MKASFPFYLLDDSLPPCISKIFSSSCPAHSWWFIEAWRVDLYSEGPPGKPDNTKVPHKLCPTCRPVLPRGAAPFSLSPNSAPERVKSCVRFLCEVNSQVALQDMCGEITAAPNRSLRSSTAAVWQYQGQSETEMSCENVLAQGESS